MGFPLIAALPVVVLRVGKSPWEKAEEFPTALEGALASFCWGNCDRHTFRLAIVGRAERMRGSDHWIVARRGTPLWLPARSVIRQTTGRQWKSQRERRAYADFALEGEVGPHSSRQTAADRQSKTGTVVGSGEAPVQLDKRLEDAFTLVVGDSRSVVLDVDAHRFLVGGRVDPYPSTLRCEFHRVREQVDHDLSQLVRIGLREET